VPHVATLLKKRLGSRLLAIGLWLAAALLAAPAAAYEVCGELRNSFGPIDYRKATRAEKELVEGAHFTPDVEALRRGSQSRRPGHDIDYTLRAFPNNPRALFAMMRLAEREKTEKPAGSRYTVSCWFDRALRFAPDDGAVRVILGIYLSKNGKKDEAIKQLEVAQKLVGNDPNLHYNLGLTYFDLKEYDKSLEHAHAAYALGFPLPGLRQKLEKAGKWRDAAVAASKSDSASKADAGVSPGDARTSTKTDSTN
jgi:tetratricopeptide (TPR) repeat protein